jgi:hypothetical protein
MGTFDDGLGLGLTGGGLGSGDTMRRPVIAWTLAALGGIVVAAALTIAASRLSSQEIALSSEPLQAGQALAPRSTPAPARPAPTPTPRRRHRPRHQATPAPAPAPVITPVPTAAPTGIPTAVPTPAPTSASVRPRSDDGSGDDHGSGSRGSDD